MQFQCQRSWWWLVGAGDWRRRHFERCPACVAWLKLATSAQTAERDTEISQVPVLICVICVSSLTMHLTRRCFEAERRLILITRQIIVDLRTCSTTGLRRFFFEFSLWL